MTVSKLLLDELERRCSDVVAANAIILEQKKIIEDMASAIGTCQIVNTPEWMSWVAELFTEHLKSIDSNYYLKVGKRGNLVCEGIKCNLN